MDEQQIANLILAEYYGDRAAGPVQGLLDVIKNLKDKGMSFIDIIKYGPTIVALLNKLIPLVTDIAERVQAVVEVIIDAFNTKPIPPVVKP